MVYIRNILNLHKILTENEYLQLAFTDGKSISTILCDDKLEVKHGELVIKRENGYGRLLFVIDPSEVVLASIRPKAMEASNENAKAVNYFMQGEWEKALHGDDAECAGFEAIADDYSLYQQGELAALYAGICSYKLGEYEDAARFLKKFSADDLTIDPAARMLLGDAYVQLDELDKAAKAFLSAASSDNEVIAPIALKKAGIVYMEQDNKKAANRVFVQIRDNYPASSEASDIDKYIALTE